MKDNYTVLSKYYDLLFQRDYKSEVSFAVSHFGKKKGTILDVGCGTGWHSHYFLKHKGFEVVCLDNNNSMLKIAKKRAKDAQFVKKDFRKINYRNKFDFIIFLFGTVSYHKDHKELEKTFSKFYSSLKEGGCFIFNVGFIKDFWKNPRNSVDIVEKNREKLILYSEYLSRGNKLTKQSYYTFIDRKGAPLVQKGYHEFTLFSIKEFEKVLQKTGFRYHIYIDFSKKKWNNKAQQGSLATFVCYK